MPDLIIVVIPAITMMAAVVHSVCAVLREIRSAKKTTASTDQSTAESRSRVVRVLARGAYLVLFLSAGVLLLSMMFVDEVLTVGWAALIAACAVILALTANGPYPGEG